MKKNKIFMLSLLLILIMPVFASAAAPTTGTGLLGGIDSQILDTVINILKYPIPLFVTPGYGASTTVPLWLLVSIIVIVFSILWIASSYVPFFRDGTNRKPRIALIIGVTLIVAFLTPIVSWIMYIIGLFTTISVLAIILTMGFLLWAMIRQSWGSSAIMNQEAGRSLADAKQMSAETARQLAQTAEYKDKTAHAVAHGLNQQKGAIQNARQTLQKISTNLNTVVRNNAYPPAPTITSTIAKNLKTFNEQLNAISASQTQTDRLMAGMNSSRFHETNVGSLGSRTAGAAATATTPRIPKGLVEIKSGADAKTNDLGRTVQEMSRVMMGGLTSKTVAVKAYELSMIGVGTLQQMERDIALETSMIEKM